MNLVIKVLHNNFLTLKISKIAPKGKQFIFKEYYTTQQRQCIHSSYTKTKFLVVCTEPKIANISANHHVII